MHLTQCIGLRMSNAHSYSTIKFQYFLNLDLVFFDSQATVITNIALQNYYLRIYTLYSNSVMQEPQNFFCSCNTLNAIYTIVPT